MQQRGALLYTRAAFPLHPDVGKEARSAVAEYRNDKPFIGYVECGLGSHGATIVLTGPMQATSELD
jgi:hypothetical protein